MMRAFWSLLAVLFVTTLIAQPADYTLDTGDVIAVVVLRHEQFSGEYTVPPDGNVVFPGVGSLQVRGQTLQGLADTLRERLGQRLRNPEVFVSLKQARPQLVFVEGQLNRPGAHPIQPGWRVADAVAAAEGLKILPERTVATLIRGEQTMPIDLPAILHRGDQRTNYLLQPGDLLSVQQKPAIRVAILGEVKRPGNYDLDADSRVIQAIAQAEGVTEFAALKRAFIDRRGEIIPFDLYRASVQGDTSVRNNPPLQDGDVIVVPQNLQRYAIVGQVTRPGYYPIPEGKPFLLSDAIAQAGGMTPRAITSTVTILRMEGNNLKRLRVPYQQFLKRGKLEANPPIQEGDVIYLAEVNRLDLGQILTAVSILNLAERLGWVR
ncbi:SLBB domain-containing protein [Synechococcus sp. RC10A2]|jgi:polysaccharide biosynthesis/export protein|uniref:SLBB domain-containing protein n=1 Tax=Synechococcus sp. RC10A2 TaxID=2964529 RepID=UPI0039C73453